MSKIVKKSLSDPSQYKTPSKFTIEEILAAIRQSIIAELDAINLYEALKTASDNENFKEVIKHIIEEEKEHAAELLALLSDLDAEQKKKDEEVLKELNVQGFVSEGVQLIKLLAQQKQKPKWLKRKKTNEGDVFEVDTKILNEMNPGKGKKEEKKKARPFSRNYDYASLNKKYAAICPECGSEDKENWEGITNFHCVNPYCGNYDDNMEITQRAKEEKALQKQIVIVVDDEDFEKLIEQQNKSTQEDILSKMEEYNKKLRYDRYLPQYGSIVEDLTQLADCLDKKRLFKLADEVDRVANEIVLGDNPIETILLGYQKIHQIAQFKEFERDVTVDKNIVAKQIAEMIEQDIPSNQITKIFNEQVVGLPKEDIRDIKLMIQKDYNWDYDELLKESGGVKQFARRLGKKASIRKEGECPFGLPIPQACKYAGDCILFMTSNCEIDECARDNKIIYNEDRTGQQCIYADNILENSVNCNFGTTTEGKHVPRLYRGSPIYPKLFCGFNAVNLDRSYHQYHDFSFMSIFGQSSEKIIKTSKGEDF